MYFSAVRRQIPASGVWLRTFVIGATAFLTVVDLGGRILLTESDNTAMIPVTSEGDGS